MYQVLLVFGIAFIIIGVVLAVMCVVSFYKDRMYEVYDMFYNRGYTAKIEKRKKAKEAKRSASRKAELSSAAKGSPNAVNELTSSFQMPMGDGVPKIPSEPARKDYSDKTVPLNQPQTVMETGQTTILNGNTDEESFSVTKSLHYSSSTDTIH